MNKKEALEKIEELKRYVENLDSSAGEIKEINHGDVFKKENDREIVCFAWPEDNLWLLQETNNFFGQVSKFMPWSKLETIKLLNDNKYKLVGRARVVVEKV